MGLKIQDIDPFCYATIEFRSSVTGIPSSLRCGNSNSTIAYRPNLHYSMELDYEITKYVVPHKRQ
jgi:hypothetical protein